MNSPRAPTLLWPLWLYLMLLTVLLALFGEWYPSGHVVAVLALSGAWLKGVAIAESFMCLRHAPLWLRALVHGWLLLVCGGLLISFT